MPKSKAKKENAKYASWAAARIMEKYQVSNNDNQDLEREVGGGREEGRGGRERGMEGSREGDGGRGGGDMDEWIDRWID